MSRPLRIEFPGALDHVTSRGDPREPIYRDDVDRSAPLPHRGQGDRHQALYLAYQEGGVKVTQLGRETGLSASHGSRLISEAEKGKWETPSCGEGLK